MRESVRRRRRRFGRNPFITGPRGTDARYGGNGNNKSVIIIVTRCLPRDCNLCRFRANPTREEVRTFFCFSPFLLRAYCDRGPIRNGPGGLLREIFLIVATPPSVETVYHLRACRYFHGKENNNVSLQTSRLRYHREEPITRDTGPCSEIRQQKKPT